MKISKLAALSVLAAASVSATAFAQEAPATDAATAEAPATADAAPSLAAGQTVYGPQGEEVATIVSVEGDNVVINTGTNQATLPSSALGAGEKGPTIAYSKDQLDAAIEAANKQANAGQAAQQPGAEAQPEGGQ